MLIGSLLPPGGGFWDGGGGRPWIVIGAAGLVAGRVGDGVGVRLLLFLLRGVHAGVFAVDVGVWVAVSGEDPVAVVLVCSSFDGEPSGVWGFVGVVGRRVVVVEGEGEAGDSGRRKGEVRGEPKERGEGL